MKGLKGLRGVAVCAALFVGLTASAFEKLALIDNFDFITHFDCETVEGTEAIIDYVLKTVGEDSTILWRPRTGGVLRFPTNLEPLWTLNGVVDKRRLPDNRVYGKARLETARTNLLAHAIAYAHSKGVKAGLHHTMEQNHFATFTFSPWNLDHPQYWVCGKDGNPWPGICSLAYDEVLEHHMRLLDELLATGVDTVYFDTWRRGGWSPGVEYVEPVLADWRKQHDCEPPKDPRDERWLKHVSGYMDRYFHAIRARLDEHAAKTGRKVRLFLCLADVGRAENTMWTRCAVDWRKYAAEGILDAVVVSDAMPSGSDVWASTRAIYEGVMKDRGKAKVYFHASEYNYHPWSIREYAKATGLSKYEVAKKLCDLAKEVGGEGVVLEVVDYRNYECGIDKALRETVER